MAGMQAMAARELLRLVVEQGSVLDPFCGSGTVLIDFRLASNLNCTCCMCSHAAEEHLRTMTRLLHEKEYRQRLVAASLQVE